MVGAIDDLDALISSLPGYAVLTDAMKQDALNRALIPDAAGVWPGQDGYAYTYDIYWAALNLVGFMASQPAVKQASSEGTAITVDTPNWGALSGYFRSMSTIAQAQSSILTEVLIPGGPHVVRTDMNGGN